MLALFATLLAFAATLLVFVVALTQAPDASAREADDINPLVATASAQDETTSFDPRFTLRCDFSHRNTDDPIVYPYSVYGEAAKGKAHSHDFFGNRSTKYNSTYTSLRNATTSTDPDGTTCVNPADKAAYWTPTVKWNGTNLKAKWGLFYYRAGDKDQKTVKPFPAGLKMVPNTHVNWRCGEGSLSSTPPTQCSDGVLIVNIAAPDCSNGKLDSTDHRSHMAYAVEQTSGTRVCPGTHPIPVPALNWSLYFPIPTTTGKVTLSSGDASTMHGDFWNAWDQKKLEYLVRHCINEFTTPEAMPECKMR